MSGSPAAPLLAAREFDLGGEVAAAAPHGQGHIHDTWQIAIEPTGQPTHHPAPPRRAILQRINHRIFRDVPALMENIERVTAHIAAQLQGQPDAARRVLTLIRTPDGQSWRCDGEGNCWRMYRFIEGSRSLDTVASPQQAFAAAQAFGEFQRQLATLPAPRLHDTLPGFHHTPNRFAAFAQALAADPVNRAQYAAPEIAFALARQSICATLLEAGLPERVTHNDTKIDNILFDESAGNALCVIDLDTVMPGCALWDFGDLVRTATSPAAEDERDLSQVAMQMPMFEALVRGYLSAAGGFLVPEEKRYLAFSGKLIAFEMGLRFLADYLDGDTYYKIHRPAHNLDRCRTQFQLVASIERHEEAMQRFVESQLT